MCHVSRLICACHFWRNGTKTLKSSSDLWKLYFKPWKQPHHLILLLSLWPGSLRIPCTSYWKHFLKIHVVWLAQLLEWERARCANVPVPLLPRLASEKLPSMLCCLAEILGSCQILSFLPFATFPLLILSIWNPAVLKPMDCTRAQ